MVDYVTNSNKKDPIPALNSAKLLEALVLLV